MTNMSDVAKKAGVSTATVSHVINGTRFVKEETKNKVKKAMDELNYHPNFAARSLRKQSTQIIGLLLPDISNSFYMNIAQGIQNELSKNDFNLIVSNSNSILNNEKSQLNFLNAQLVDGLIIRPSFGDHSFLDNYSNEFPMVFIDCKPNNYDCNNCILVENIKGSFEAVNLLINKGHKKIGLINGFVGETTSDERFIGYKKAFSDNDIKIDNNLIKNGDYRMRSGYILAKELIKKTDITALFITNNSMTIGALNYIKEAKISVPDELSVIGFDDSEWAKLVTPSLTVVKQLPYEMGVKAANVLLDEIKNNTIEGKSNEYRLPTEIVIRESC